MSKITVTVTFTEKELREMLISSQHGIEIVDKQRMKKIKPFVVADGEEYFEVMQDHFQMDEEDIHNSYEAFVAGVQYALTKMNTAFEKAGIELEVQSTDLGESMGYMLVRVDDTPEDFVKRVLKKPVLMVEPWL